MFYAQGRDVVFIETAMHFKKQYHTFIECVPLPKEFDLDPAIYFKVKKEKKKKSWRGGGGGLAGGGRGGRKRERKGSTPSKTL